jgi:hypothetical protein
MWISEKVVLKILVSFYAFIIVMFLLWQGRELLLQYFDGKVEMKVGMCSAFAKVERGEASFVAPLQGLAFVGTIGPRPCSLG